MTRNCELCFVDERVVQQPKTQRKSNQSDEEVLQEALHLYCDETRKTFMYNDSWKVLYSSPRWKEFEATILHGVETRKIKKVGSSGYTTSLDACVGLNLNDDDELKLKEIARSMSRDKTKRKGNRSSLNASDFSSKTEERQKMTETIDQYNLN